MVLIKLGLNTENGKITQRFELPDCLASLQMSALREMEDLIYRFLEKTLEREDVKEIVNRWELQDKVDEETQEEIRHQIWTLLWSQVRWEYLLQRLREDKNADEDSVDEEDDDNLSQESK